MFSKPQTTENRPQNEFRHNSKFIRHKKTCPTSQHPQNPPKTAKLNLPTTENIQNIANWVSTKGN